MSASKVDLKSSEHTAVSAPTAPPLQPVTTKVIGLSGLSPLEVFQRQFAFKHRHRPPPPPIEQEEQEVSATKLLSNNRIEFKPSAPVLDEIAEQAEFERQLALRCRLTTDWKAVETHWNSGAVHWTPTSPSIKPVTKTPPASPNIQPCTAPPPPLPPLTDSTKKE